MAKKGSDSKAMVKWDEELAKQAAAAAEMERNAGGGQFFSVRGGTLQFNDAPVPGNRMAAVILDSILENVFYKGDFDPDNPSSPACFAFGRDEPTLAPHEKAPERQADACADCPMNKWGTADKGRGKACKNVRRLGLIPAGSFTANGSFDLLEDPEAYRSAPIAFFKLPVTSVKGYAAFVKSAAATMKVPPHALATKISVVPDAKTQFKVVFEPLKRLPVELMAVVMERREVCMSQIDFPYVPRDDEGEAEARPARGTGRKGKKY